ncbi:MAG: arginase [Halocynthiibacter sp.]
MTKSVCTLIGAPVDSGKARNGCLMGPDSYRVAGLKSTLETLGHTVSDVGNMAPQPVQQQSFKAKNPALIDLAENIGWVSSLSQAAERAMSDSVPIFLGGDHFLSAGTVTGVAAHAAKVKRPLFVLWLDAHTDYHTAETTKSGNLHGTPVGYFTGREGFVDFPTVSHPVPEENVCLIGIRSVDEAENEALQNSKMHVVDMRMIDEDGLRTPLMAFLARVKAANGLLHVSLDVDFLDPSIAPAVGTTVPGGATMREAHLAMEILHDSGLVTSLDLVELNPFLDERGRTASLMVDLTASLFGRRVFDRPTRSFEL